MIIYKQSTDINQFLISQHRQGKKIGFVPTMGALHEGHLSLIEESKKLNQMTVCSIFINPRQFNNPNDLLHYPVTIDQDIQKLEEHGCDILFLPTISEIYPEDFQPKHYDLGYLETVLEGKYRPGHFQGVCAVVEQLLKICVCHSLYLGTKDYQQCLVIKRLCEINECDIQIVFCETKRESDGLAMSSRNLRLGDEQRKLAPMIYKTLQYISQHYTSDNDQTMKVAHAMLVDNDFKIDYVQVCDEELKQLDSTTQNGKKIALIAAELGTIRLIDNLSFN